MAVSLSFLFSVKRSFTHNCKVNVISLTINKGMYKQVCRTSHIKSYVKLASTLIKLSAARFSLICRLFSFSSRRFSFSWRRLSRSSRRLSASSRGDSAGDRNGIGASVMHINTTFLYHMLSQLQYIFIQYTYLSSTLPCANQNSY